MFSEVVHPTVTVYPDSDKFGVYTGNPEDEAAGQALERVDYFDGERQLGMPTWDDVVAIGTRFPGVEVTTSYGTPSMRIRKKFMCRLRTDPDALVLRVADMGEREALLQGQPDAFFTTPHYDGHPYVLARLDDGGPGGAGRAGGGGVADGCVQATAGRVRGREALATPTAIVRRPSPPLADGIVTHLERTPVDPDRALEQWQDYVDVLSGHGWRIVEAPPADDCPDGVFVEDAAVVLGGVAVLTRPGAAQRRPEVESMAAAMAGMRLTTHRIEAPATLDGGDVMAVGDTVYVGLGGRTDERRRAPARRGPRTGGHVGDHRAAQQGAAPEVRGHGAARRIGDRLPGRPRRPRRVPGLRGRAGGGRRARGAAGRRRAADGRRGAAHGGAARRTRLPAGGGGHRRVREARGLRHVPVGASAR